jgi:sensor histidine kinase YesM
MNLFQRLVRGNKLQRHLFFSLGVLALLGLGMFLMHLSGFRFRDVAAALMDCLFFLLCIYIGRWVAACSYLKKQLVLFGLYSVLAFTGLSVFKWLIVRYVFRHPYAGYAEVLWGAMPFFLVALVMGMLLKIIRASIQKELQDAELQAQQKTMEFNLLQSQLSPHFLFNVLNNLYGISIDDHERIPPLLLKLSNLLRYSVYGGKKPFVPLKDELEYIQTYIDFERIRISDRLVLEMDMEPVNDKAIQIAPSVLIVFIENAFKHAKNSLNQKIFIRISLKISGNFIAFDVVNSYHEDENKDRILDESSGLGLTNTLKRLELLYGDDHQLKQYRRDGTYHVELNLKIRPEKDDQLPDRR